MTGTNDTIVKSLIANPSAISNDAIKVWVQGIDYPDAFYDGLEEYLDSRPADAELIEAIPVNDRLELTPGQHLLYFRAWGGPMNVRESFVRIPQPLQLLEFSNGRFICSKVTGFYAGVYLGDGRPLRAAANRAMKATKQADWIGGIADFASRFLRAPKG
jgi:hypothetical protein